MNNIKLASLCLSVFARLSSRLPLQAFASHWYSGLQRKPVDIFQII